MKQWYNYLVSQLRPDKDEINQIIYVLFWCSEYSISFVIKGRLLEQNDVKIQEFQMRDIK